MVLTKMSEIREYTMQVSSEFEECRKQAFALAYRLLNNRDDALEVVQSSIEKGINHPGAPALDHQEFKPWLFTVVRNKSIDILRHQKRVRKVEHEEYHSSAPTCTEPDKSLQQMQLKESLEEAINELNMQQKEIILLRDYHNFSYADIAKILGIANGSVMSRLHRARMALREILIKKGFSLGGAQ
ncbi:RNA polymerase sigma factor [Aliikangiella coralliicola]|uniref:RNA polymerase sigma factor n=2 Tax=Aliikangiella coralliicola TaxID=2592383 RepID=A0A545U7Z5_9GAMM|nr:RNA polymerase sigma factor [Aliikangiella coralliicola]